jgi:hypothetical protein
MAFLFDKIARLGARPLALARYRLFSVPARARQLVTMVVVILVPGAWLAWLAWLAWRGRRAASTPAP